MELDNFVEHAALAVLNSLRPLGGIYVQLERNHRDSREMSPLGIVAAIGYRSEVGTFLTHGHRDTKLTRCASVGQ